MEIYGLCENGITSLDKKGYKMVKRYHPNVIEIVHFMGRIFILSVMSNGRD